MIDFTLPLSIVLFFAGLSATLRFALPRWKYLEDLKSDVEKLKSAPSAPTNDPRVDELAKAVSKLQGVLVIKQAFGPGQPQK